MVSSTEATADEPNKNICRDLTARRIRLLNAADEKSDYAELVASFAYLKAREITFGNLDYDLEPQEVWSILQTIHGLPITAYNPSLPWNEQSTDNVAVIYADRSRSRFWTTLPALSSNDGMSLFTLGRPGKSSRISAVPTSRCCRYTIRSLRDFSSELSRAGRQHAPCARCVPAGGGERPCGHREAGGRASSLESRLPARSRP